MHLHGYSLDVRERQCGKRWLTTKSDSDKYCTNYFPASVRGTLVVHWGWGGGGVMYDTLSI